MNKMDVSLLTGMLCLGLQSEDVGVLYTPHTSPQWTYVAQEEQHKDIAVLLIDMQEAYRVDLSITERYHEIPSQLAVLNYAQENGFPVIVIKYDNLSVRHDGIGLMQELETGLSLPYETINKKWDNAFHETPLDEMLKWYHIKDLVLIGAYASYCVQKTGDGAVMHGYSIATSPDLIIDTIRVKDWGLNESQKWYSENGTLFSDHNEVIDYMNMNANKESLQCESAVF